MGKEWVKQSYEAKKIASMFWWNSFLFEYLIWFIMLIIVSAISIGLPKLAGIIQLIVNVTAVIFAEKIAIKKVKKRAIIKRNQIDEITKKFAIKYVILITVLVL